MSIDPYKKIKSKSNKLALELYPELIKRLSKSSDRLLDAVKLSIIGNIIDYGAKNSFNVERDLDRLLNEEISAKKGNKKNSRYEQFHYKRFKNALKAAKTVLYLADNAGETVFDRILIEEIKRAFNDRRIIYVVKEIPIINDATIEDAYTCGIDKIAEVISSGSNAPGTVLSLCSKDFLKLYRRVDMIISKGQGNFEALSGEKREIFFLFLAKCPVIARDAGCQVGDIILLDNSCKVYKS